MNNLTNNRNKKKKKKLNEEISTKNELNLFEFPPRLIHPSLLLHPKSLECILNWFSNHCNYAHVIRVIGYRLLMKSDEIKLLQIHIKNEWKEIKKQMNLKYEAISIPSKVYARSYLTIKENPLWNYNDRFKVIITTKEEEVKVKEFIKSIQSQFNNETKNKKPCSSEVERELNGTNLCCLLICDDPDNPNLSITPLSLYFQDKSTYTSRICRDCILDSIQNAINPYLNDKGQLDQNALDFIKSKPDKISTYPSKSYCNGQEYWPQIPIGQLISLLINNDVKTSMAISKWLSIVTEFAVRVLIRKFTFCPNHPHDIFIINGQAIHCNNPTCYLFFCPDCFSWHSIDSNCNYLGNTNYKKCPNCSRLIEKNGGCNHIRCHCGCHFCYKCGKRFTTSDQCYDHLREEHGGFFDSDDDYDNDNNNDNDYDYW